MAKIHKTNAYKEKQLRNHKLVASGLFFLMALIYGLMVYFQNNSPQKWMGFVAAFSEAGMVGALADWFAVTALFRHPLGLPIPHTNLIRKKQKDLGENLGTFVKENFLNPENIRPYIENLDVVKYASGWLIKENNQKILEQETVQFIKKIINNLADDEVESFLSRKSVELLKTINYQKLLSNGILYLVEKNEHNKLLDQILPGLKEYVYESDELIRQRISENRPFIAFLAGRKISKELTDGFAQFIEEIQADENHFAREKLTKALVNFSINMKTSDSWGQKFSQLKEDLIHQENISFYINDLWMGIKRMMLENIDNPDSVLREYLKKNIKKLAENLINDPALGLRINHWIRHFGYQMILKNREEVEKLISSTVSGWEGKELSRKLELEVGKDLQYIRINGTLVGGLVGLLIYTITYFFLN